MDASGAPQRGVDVRWNDAPGTVQQRRGPPPRAADPHLQDGPGRGAATGRPLGRKLNKIEEASLSSWRAVSHGAVQRTVQRLPFVTILQCISI